MEVNSMLTGKRGVSLPFTDYCDPIMSDQAVLDDVMTSLITYGKRAEWKYFELRTEHPFPREITPSSFYYGHTLDLSQEEETIFRVSGTVRKEISGKREGRHRGYHHQIIGRCPGILSSHCMRRKDHSLPPQPYMWFRKIHDHVIAKNHGLWPSHPITELDRRRSYCHFGDQAFYKYGASDKGTGIYGEQPRHVGSHTVVRKGWLFAVQLRQDRVRKQRAVTVQAGMGRRISDMLCDTISGVMHLSSMTNR
jgi:hypothetical protein